MPFTNHNSPFTKIQFLMKLLSYTEGSLQWTSLLKEARGLLPFAYSPSLYDLYENYFHWKSYYVIIKSDNEAYALLPLIFTGHAWVSLPHMSHGGILFLKNPQEIDSAILINIIIEKLNTKVSGFYEIEVPATENNRFSDIKYFIRTTTEHYSKHFVESEKQNSFLFLDPIQDEMFNKLSSNLRRKIRKAEGSGIIIKSGNKQLINDFYKVYTKNISRLKSMPYAKSYFVSLKDCFAKGSKTFFVAYMNKIPVGAAFLGSYGNYHENIYFATLKEAQKYYVSDLLHWEMIKYSIERQKNNGFKSKHTYSFGRSTIGRGVYKYKNNWPVQNSAIHLYTNFPDARSNLFLQKLWETLPGFVRKYVGERVVKRVY